MSVLHRLAARVDALPQRAVLVGVDGVDGSGKTTLADALAREVQRPVARLSVDDFLRSAEERYRLGRRSPVGCYRDTFDHAALRRRLSAHQESGGRAALLVDGVFLQRPELDLGWDLVVHLRVPDEEVLRRVVVRDPGEPQEVAALYRERYLPAQRLYEAEVDPVARADVVLDNTDPAAPVVLRWDP